MSPKAQRIRSHIGRLFSQNLNFSCRLDLETSLLGLRQNPFQSNFGKLALAFGVTSSSNIRMDASEPNLLIILSRPYPVPVSVGLIKTAPFIYRNGMSDNLRV